MTTEVERICIHCRRTINHLGNTCPECSAAPFAELNEPSGNSGQLDPKVRLEKLEANMRTRGTPAAMSWAGQLAEIRAALSRLAPAAPAGEVVGHVRGIVMRGGGEYAAIEYTGESLPYGTALCIAPQPAPPAQGFDAEASERVAALLHEEATGEPWTVVGVEHDGPDRGYYRGLAKRVLAAAAKGVGRG